MSKANNNTKPRSRREERINIIIWPKSLWKQNSTFGFVSVCERVGICCCSSFSGCRRTQRKEKKNYKSWIFFKEYEMVGDRCYSTALPFNESHSKMIHKRNIWIFFFLLLFTLFLSIYAKYNGSESNRPIMLREWTKKAP